MKNLIYILIMVVLHFGSFALMGAEAGPATTEAAPDDPVIVIIVCTAAVVIWSYVFWLYRGDILPFINKLFGASTASIKQSLTSIKLPKIEFQDSGWILLYRIAGWLCMIVGSLVLIVGLASDAGSSTEEGLVFFCCALLAASANFFAAHILRLQEKTAAFTEVTAGIMEKHHELMVENVNLLRSIAQKTEDKG